MSLIMSGSLQYLWFVSLEMFDLFQYEKARNECIDCGDSVFDALPSWKEWEYLAITLVR